MNITINIYRLKWHIVLCGIKCFASLCSHLRNTASHNSTTRHKRITCYSSKIRSFLNFFRSNTFFSKV